MSSWKKTSRHCSINLKLQLNLSNIRLVRVYVKYPEIDSVGIISGKYLPDVRDSILGGGVADRRILVGMGWESISSRSGSARYVMSSFRAELKVQNATAIFFVIYIRFKPFISNILEIFAPKILPWLKAVKRVAIWKHIFSIWRAIWCWRDVLVDGICPVTINWNLMFVV